MGYVWRGVRKDLRVQFPKGTRVTWWGFTSTTPEMSVLEDEQLCGGSGERTLFMLSVSLGFDITAFSFYSAETEVLLPPGISLEVTGQMELGSGLYVVQMRQVESPHCLLNCLGDAASAPVATAPAAAPTLTLVLRYISRVYLDYVSAISRLYLRSRPCSSSASRPPSAPSRRGGAGGTSTWMR